MVNVRYSPGTKGWRPPAKLPPYSPRLGERVGLVLVAASDLGGMPERFGLGAYLVISGRSVLAAGIIVPDDLEPGALAEVEGWARSHRAITTSGSRRWAVVSRSDFFDPYSGVFVKRAYSGAGWCIGADLGRAFGILAEHCSPRTGAHANAWTIWPSGWSKEHDRGRRMRRSPHRPPLRVEARRVGTQVEFAPSARDNGKYSQDRQWRGAFLDVLSLAYALDADRGASFAEHRANFGLTPFDLPIAVTPGADGAAQMAEAVTAVHELAVVLDEHASRWFTTPRDRAEGRGRIDLVRTVSPGGIAAQVLSRSGVRAPMEIFDLSDDEHRSWAETFHGGWCEADAASLGVPFQAITADASSCFPLVAHLIGWWDLLGAERIQRQDVTAALRRLCEKAVADPAVLLDPKVWHNFGCCLVEVIPGGDVFPIEIEDEYRPDGRMEVVPVFSPDRPMFFSALDVLGAAVLSAQVPEIVEATAYRPVGCQAGLRRRLPILPGLVVTSDQDPAVSLVEHRRKAKAAEDLTLAAELRVGVNSLVFGNFSRTDEILRKEGDRWVRDERPGPWACFPIASSVTAGSHLLLAILDRLVHDRGSIVGYRDTDSSIIPANPLGGVLVLTDGSTIRELSHAEVDEVLGAFAPLSTDPGWPVWKTERGTPEEPLTALVFGPKRHVEMVGDQIIEATEAGLGGSYADPAAMRGKAPGGRRRWSLAAVEREIAYARDRRRDPKNAVRTPAPWDTGSPLKFPAFRRLMVKTPEMARLLPASLGARMGTRYIQASRAEWSGQSWGKTIVAIDPGGDLSGWQDFAWLDKSTGEPVQVTTESMSLEAVILESLAERAGRWSREPRSEPVTEIEVNPKLIAYPGRVSGVIDADADGLGDLASRRTIHEDADRLTAVQKAAKQLGRRAFSRRTGLPETVAERAAGGFPISSGNVNKALTALAAVNTSARACSLDGCDEPVYRPNASYCEKVHQDQAYRLRRKAKAPAPRPRRSRRSAAKPDPYADMACPLCGTVLLGKAAQGPCPVCPTPCNEKPVTP